MIFHILDSYMSVPFPKFLLDIRYSSSPSFKDETSRARFARPMSNGAWYILLDGWDKPRYFKDENVQRSSLVHTHGPGFFHGAAMDGWALYEGGKCLVVLSGHAPLRLDAKEMDPDVLPRYDDLIAFCASVACQDGASSLPYAMLERTLRQTPEISRSVLWTYLKGRLQQKKTLPGHLVFPFSSNLSQMDALEMAMTQRLSVIEGPPGTGKTQTILNLIANLVMRGKSVAVVSGGNAAVDNVREKLDKAGFICLGASLGNKENQKTFFDAASQRLDVTCPFERLSSKERIQLTLGLDKLVRRSRERFLLETEIQKSRETVRELKTQIRTLTSFLERRSLEDVYPRGLGRLGQKRLDALRNCLLERLSTHGPFSWKDRMHLFLKFGIHMDKTLLDTFRDEPRLLGLMLLRARLSQTEARLDEGERRLEACKQAVVDLQNVSRRLFEDWYRRHVDRMERGFDLQNYRTSFSGFMASYPLVLSTTFSLSSCTQKGYLYDCLIIDEASQVTIPSAASAMAMARSVVIVGDDRQLPCIIPQGAPRTGAADDKDGYDASRWSILDSVKKVFASDLPLVLLREHYRCHPLIADFFSKRFYDGQLIVMTPEEKDFPFCLLDVPAGKVLSLDGSLASKRQAQETMDCLERLKEMGYGRDDVALVAPYRGQCELLGSEYGIPFASTVHRCQGREAPAVVFDVVRNQVNDFVDDAHLLNVAVSRARELFVLAGPMDNLVRKRDSNLASLIGYVRRHDEQGTHQYKSLRSSVFDLLYPGADDEALDRVRKTGSGSLAERAFLESLLGVLDSDGRFGSWRCIREYYLMDLTASFEWFTLEETEFIKHGSRLDFLIYDTLSKEPVMAFEVDGVSFHDNAVQRRRDALKDSVMRRLDIPLVRYRTDADVSFETIREDILGIYAQRNSRA